MSAALNPNLLLVIPLAPLAGAVIAGLFGKTVGRRGAHSITILGVLVSFILSAMVLKSVAVDSARFNATIYEWMVVGGMKPSAPSSFRRALSSVRCSSAQRTCSPVTGLPLPNFSCALRTASTATRPPTSPRLK